MKSRSGLFTRFLGLFTRSPVSLTGPAAPSPEQDHAETTARIADQWLRGCKVLELGKRYYFAKRFTEALKCFDDAIALTRGVDIDAAEVFNCRGGTLQALNFDLDAIDDFNRAISSAPDDCNSFYQRSFSKVATGDLSGAISDLGEAIRLSRVDNALNKVYDEGAREKGYNCVADLYEMQLFAAKERLDFQERIAAQRASLPNLPESVKNRQLSPVNLRRRAITRECEVAPIEPVDQPRRGIGM